MKLMNIPTNNPGYKSEGKCKYFFPLIFCIAFPNRLTLWDIDNMQNLWRLVLHVLFLSRKCRHYTPAFSWRHNILLLHTL